MADVKISQLPVLSAVGSTSDVLPIVDGGTTYQVAVSTLLSTTGNITGGYIIGNGSQLTSLTGANVTGTVANATYATTAGTVTTNAQSNITSVGTLTSLNSGVISSSGNVTGSNILTGGLVSATGNVQASNIRTTGLVSATGAVTAASVVGGVITGSSTSVTGNVTGASLVGAIATASQTAITAVGTLTSLNSGAISSSGNVTASTLKGNLLIGNTNINNVGQVYTDDLIANTSLTSYGDTFTRYEVRAGGGMAFDGSVKVYRQSSPNLQVSILGNPGTISAVGNITGDYFIGNGSQLTGISAGGGGANISNGTSNVTVVSSGGNVTTGIGGTANVLVAATTGLFVTGNVSASGNITGGNIATVGLITATGNVYANTLVLGSGSSGNISNVDVITANSIVLSSGSGGNISNINFITGNVVSLSTYIQSAVYANTTVRDSAIASPQPGMIIYVTGTGLQVRGATSWNTVSGTST
jgi:hypothetical protein